MNVNDEECHQTAAGKIQKSPPDRKQWDSWSICLFWSDSAVIKGTVHPHMENPSLDNVKTRSGCDPELFCGLRHFTDFISSGWWWLDVWVNCSFKPSALVYWAVNRLKATWRKVLVRLSSACWTVRVTLWVTISCLSACSSWSTTEEQNSSEWNKQVKKKTKYN